MFQAIQKEQQQDAGPVQAKLEVGREDDVQEKEADHVADKVMRMSNGDGDSTMPAGNIRSKMPSPEIKKMPQPLVRKMPAVPVSTFSVSPSVEKDISSSKGAGQKLDNAVQEEMSSKIGSDFSEVNVHTNAHAQQMSREIGAKAFTHGNDIYFNQGQYNPSSEQGKHLLAHELTHTVQQSGAIQKKIQRAVWEDNVYTEKNPVDLTVKGKAFGETEMVINDLANTQTNGDFFRHIQPLPNVAKIEVDNNTKEAIVMFKDDYQIRSHAQMQVLEKPIDNDTGWKYPVKLQGQFAVLKTTYPALAKSTQITGIIDDPSGNDKLYDRVKGGEEQHAKQAQALHERYLVPLEAKIKALYGRGVDPPAAAKDLYAKMQTDKEVTRLIDAFMVAFSSNFKYLYDQKSYGLHFTDALTDFAKDVDPVAKTIKFNLEHRYSNDTVKDPSNENVNDAKGKEKAGYRKKSPIVAKAFDPAKLIIKGNQLVDTTDNTALPKMEFKSTSSAQIALDAIVKNGFNQLEYIGPFIIFSVSGVIASGSVDKISNKKIEPLFLNVYYDKYWSLAQSMQRDDKNQSVTFRMLNFGDSLNAMNDAYTAYDTINARGLSTFNWIGTSENPEMSFYSL